MGAAHLLGSGSTCARAATFHCVFFNELADPDGGDVIAAGHVTLGRV